MRLLLAFALAVLSLPASAFNYDLLIVACKDSTCERIADRTISGGLSETISYTQSGLQLQIETLSSRVNEVNAQISIKLQLPASLAVGAQPTLENVTQSLQTLVEPRTLKQGIYTSIFAFPNDGRFYRIWARLATL